MRGGLVLAAACAAIFNIGTTARAQTAPGSSAPGVIMDGSGNVSVGGQAAARKGERTTGSGADGAGKIVEGSSNVFINGRPAATLGDRTGCGGIVVGGSSNVFVNGKPLARSGDLTTGCPGK
ncbi:MAG: PAAR domain-containing protein [Hyphomicrobiaceae bacterium]